MTVVKHYTPCWLFTETSPLFSYITPTTRNLAIANRLRSVSQQFLTTSGRYAANGRVRCEFI